ncbi:MAG TPA: cyclic nucleotide-binding domain-containing protein, partial [Flavisolibacter sp.]|nr:cyclic nucleotide-binding domain-containing protein [Flavisolibacter sp.]
METLESFLGFLNKFVPLTVDEFQSLIAPYIEIRNYKKKDVITKSGEVENYINFVSKGLVRKYFVHEGNEIVTQIAREGQIIHSQESFYSRTASQYVIEAIEPTALLSISHDHLDKIYSSGAMMERM